MHQLSSNSSVAEVVRDHPTTRRIFDEHGLRGCGGEHGPAESVEFFATVHEVEIGRLLSELRAEIENPRAYDFQVSAADAIYRRFFKLGVVTVLTLGCMWGAINLLQIALGGTFLRLDLLSAIHAHAHAMIWGWVATFVMGFAYQSFPRFKNTTLWRPELARASFVLIIGGILARTVAELGSPAPYALWAGAVSAALEITAAALFVTILFRTAKQSSQPPAGHEKFLVAAFFWFVVQSVLSPLFFFAKATAPSPDKLVMRIATIDGPLRDIQLLGFAVLIIAGVSQRFLPGVYGLPKPARDRSSLIFAMINGSLLLNVASYVLLLRTMQPVFVFTLEIAYLQMPIWAVLLVKQLRVFAPAANPDRSLKFVRVAYAWLLLATFMMPLFPVYSFLTGQMFAHSYMGSQRHALTVGFISMMILGTPRASLPSCPEWMPAAWIACGHRLCC